MSVVVSLCRHSLQCHYRGAEKTAPYFLCSAPTVQHYRKKTTPSARTHKRRRSSLMQHSWQALITVHPLRDTKRTYKGHVLYTRGVNPVECFIWPTVYFVSRYQLRWRIALLEGLQSRFLASLKDKTFTPHTLGAFQHFPHQEPHDPFHQAIKKEWKALFCTTLLLSTCLSHATTRLATQYTNLHIPRRTNRTQFWIYNIFMNTKFLVHAPTNNIKINPNKWGPIVIFFFKIARKL